LLGNCRSGKERRGAGRGKRECLIIFKQKRKKEREREAASQAASQPEYRLPAHQPSRPMKDQFA
jgi:hypothetical protein